jgi:FkbM family methyltransferase
MIRRLAKRVLEGYVTRLPYHLGKWRVVEGVVKGMGIEEGDRGQEFLVERQGLRWKLGVECAMQRRLYYHGALDPYDERELFSRMEPGAVFLDIGSYYGYYGLRAAEGGAEAYLFEPAGVNFGRLEENLRLNPAMRCRGYRLALSDRVGKVAMSIAKDGNRGTGRIEVEADGGEATEEVETTTLDLFVMREGIGKVGGMKLDVEGAEWKVLVGGMETLKRDRPVMLMEYNPPCLRRFGVKEEELLGKLRGMGYGLWRATRGGLKRFEGLGGEEYCNLVCVAE